MPIVQQLFAEKTQSFPIAPLLRQVPRRRVRFLLFNVTGVDAGDFLVDDRVRP